MSAALLLGCGHTLPQTIAASQKALHAVPVVAQPLAQTWASQVDARIAYCVRQGASTEDERRTCMGVFGQGDAWEEDFETLRDAYDTAAEALETMRVVAERLEARVRGQKVQD